MCLPRIVLTSIAGAYQLGGVGNRRWPVEPLAESVSDERPRRSMVSAGSCVQVPKQGLAFPGGDASLEDARWASFVQLTIADDVSLGSSCQPLGLGSIHRRHSSSEAIKEGDPPVCPSVGLGRPCIDFHGLGLGRWGLGNRGGLGPCGGIDRWALLCR